MKRFSNALRAWLCEKLFAMAQSICPKEYTPSWIEITCDAYRHKGHFSDSEMGVE